MINEIWKNIEDNDNYMISNLGRVKSMERTVSFGWSKRTIKSRILKPKDNGNGYKLVRIGNKYLYIHRLTATHFIPNPDNLQEIDHINGNKTDNRVENLRWVTHKDNMNNPITKHKMNSCKKKPVLQYTINNELINKWDSISDVEKKLNIDNSTIIRCCKGKQKTAGGYKWQYAENEMVG